MDVLLIEDEQKIADFVIAGFAAADITTHHELDGFRGLNTALIKTFDAIVLDPPKFAPTAAHAERAARAYKDINSLALKLLAPGGVLFTFSCSGGIGPELEAAAAFLVAARGGDDPAAGALHGIHPAQRDGDCRQTCR